MGGFCDKLYQVITNFTKVSKKNFQDVIPLILQKKKNFKNRPFVYINIQDILSHGINDLETRHLKLHWGLQVNGKLGTRNPDKGHYWNNHYKAFTNFENLSIEEFDVIHHWITHRVISSCLLDINNWHNIYNISVLNGMFGLAKHSLQLCNQRPQGFECPALDVDGVYNWTVLDNKALNYYLKVKELIQKGWEVTKHVNYTNQRLVLLRRSRN